MSRNRDTTTDDSGSEETSGGSPTTENPRGLTPAEIEIAESFGYDITDLNEGEFVAVQQAAAEAEADALKTSGQSTARRTNPLDVSTATGENPGAWAVQTPGLGVEPETPSPYNQFMWGEGFESGAPQQRMQRYKPTSARHILNGMTSAEIAALEREFIRAGYWEEDTRVTGTRASMIGTFEKIIIAADNNRVSWEMQIEGDTNSFEAWKEENPEPGKAPYPSFAAPTFLKPDYATLAQRTKLQLRNNLGRDPTSSEMTLLTQYLGTAKKDEWQANTYDTAYADWQTRARAYETETNQMSAPTVQGVDAEARFSEMFESRYENELDHRERVDRSQRKSANLFNSIDTISRMTS